MLTMRTKKQRQYGPEIILLARQGKSYKEIAKDTGAKVSFISNYVRANKREVRASLKEMRKRTFELITLNTLTFDEMLDQIIEAEWSVRYLEEMNVPSSVASGLLRQYDEITMALPMRDPILYEKSYILKELVKPVAYIVFLYYMIHEELIDSDYEPSYLTQRIYESGPWYKKIRAFLTQYSTDKENFRRVTT